MSATLFVDKGQGFVSVRPETLTDGSTVWNLHFRDGQTFHCTNERSAEEAFRLIAAGIRLAHGDDNILIL